MFELKVASPERWHLTGRATIHFAADIWEALERASEQSEDPSVPIVLDLGELEALDTAGAQLLLAFRNSMGWRRVRCDGCPDQLREMLELTGLYRHLTHEQE